MGRRKIELPCVVSSPLISFSLFSLLFPSFSFLCVFFLLVRENNGSGQRFLRYGFEEEEKIGVYLVIHFVITSGREK